MILYHGSNTGNIKVLKPICKYFVMESTLSNFFPNLFNRVHSGVYGGKAHRDESLFHTSSIWAC